MDIGHSSNKEIGWLPTKQKLDICFCNPSQWNTLILMQTFTTFCIALFFTSKRKRRKCIFGRASIGFGRILQQRPNKSLPYKYPHTLMNALCYHPKKSDIRNFSSCEKIFFSPILCNTHSKIWKAYNHIIPIFLQYIWKYIWIQKSEIKTDNYITFQLLSMKKTFEI